MISSSVPVEGDHLLSYIKYKSDGSHHYRPSLISFLHRQPDGTQLATTRYYRIVFHCNILPGSLYLRFSKAKPFRTVVQNRQDPSSKFLSSKSSPNSMISFSNLRLSIGRRLQSCTNPKLRLRPLVMYE